MSITVNQLSKSFGHQIAVNAISFTAGKGEILGFLGPNGAGKSTTMRMITGFLAPDGGSIEVAGAPVNVDNEAVRLQIGYLSEQNPLYLDMYVREYLRYVARLYHLPQPNSRIEEVIKRTGLQSESHKLIRSLSKGYRQRVGLAQAILHDPEVLILDEATTGLDPNQVVEIRQLIRELGKSKTILLSTHIMQEVQALCDRVIILNNGKIVADGKIPMLSQMLSQHFRTKVTFTSPVADAHFRDLPGYQGHEMVAGNTYIVSSAMGELNESLFDLAASQRIKIIEMVSLETSVENIFQKLTASGS